MPTPEKHALLSASSANKWLHCTPSARLEERFTETTTEYAEEGRLAHSIAELKLRKAFIEPIGPRAFSNRLKKLKSDPHFEKEMLVHTDAYLDLVSKTIYSYVQPPYIAAEKKIDYSKYVPEGFGTCDCIVLGSGILHLFDFKYGKGVPVPAEKNLQMMLYALGVITEYSFLYKIGVVKLTIVQPRLDNISEWGLSAEDLLKWGKEIKPIAEKAYKGEGEYKTGDWCRFCKAKALCRARADFNIGLEEYKQVKPPIISDTEVGNLLQKAKDLVKWAKDLEEYALDECLKGNEVPGWKAVEGRSARAFTDQDAAFKALKESGIDEAMLYERKPLTLAATEKLVGKPKFKELVGQYINTPPGKPTLVPETDKREPIKRETAEEDFASTIDEGVKALLKNEKGE